MVSIEIYSPDQLLMFHASTENLNIFFKLKDSLPDQHISLIVVS